MTSHSYNAIRLALIVSMGGFLFGFDASIISGAVTFLAEDFDLNNWELGLVVAAPTLGGIISGATSGPLSDRFGRKTLLLSVALLYLFSATASVWAPSYEALVIARFIGGLGFGSLGLAPIYIAEISPAAIRGRMIAINQFNIVIGFSAAYFSNYALLNWANSASPLAEQWLITSETWRWMLGIELIPAALFVLMLFTIPESPRWLALNHQKEKARAILKKLIPEDKLEETMGNLSHDEKCYNKPLLARIQDLFSPYFRSILIIGVIVAVAQQITGINAVYFYAPTIFEQSGVSTNAAFAQAVMVGIINVVFTIIAMVLVDNIGRRPLLLSGMAGIAISMLICSYGFYDSSYYLTSQQILSLQELHSIDLSFLNDQEVKSKVEWLMLVSATTELTAIQNELIDQAFHANTYLVLLGILGFVAAFAMSLGPIMWILLPEIFPNHLRGVGMGVTGIVNAMVSFTIQLIFPWEIDTIGPAATFFIYGALGVAFWFILLKVLPETKGRSLETKLVEEEPPSQTSPNNNQLSEQAYGQ